MRNVLIGLIAAGCVPPESVLEPFGEIDGAVFLDADEDLEDAYSDRVVPVSRPLARLTPDGPNLIPDIGFPYRPLVVVDPTPWPRVGIDAGDVRVLIYIDRSQLKRWVVTPHDGTGPWGDGQVRLPLGQEVDVIDERDDQIQLQAQFSRWTAVPWVPRHVIDEVVDLDDDRGILPELPQGASVALRGGAEVFDTPGGELIAWFEGEPEGYAARATQPAPEARGWVPVAFQLNGAAVRGWAHTDDVDPAPTGFGFGSSGGCSHCGGGGMTTWYGQPAHVPIGTPLHDQPGGPVVAIVTRDIGLPLDALEAGAQIVRATPLGTVTLWAEPWDVLAF